jgi:hypothetical protein
VVVGSTLLPPVVSTRVAPTARTADAVPLAFRAARIVRGHRQVRPRLVSPVGACPVGVCWDGVASGCVASAVGWAQVGGLVLEVGVGADWVVVVWLECVSVPPVCLVVDGFSADPAGLVGGFAVGSELAFEFGPACAVGGVGHGSGLAGGHGEVAAVGGDGDGDGGIGE